MPDKLHIDEQTGVITVNSFGAVTKEDIEESIAQVQELFSTKGLHHVIIDTNDQETMPRTNDIYQIFSAIPRDFKMAMLIHKDQKTEADIRFAENVGINKGIRIKIFLDKGDAVEWLSRDPDGIPLMQASLSVS